jgi:hypothetical protein
VFGVTHKTSEQQQVKHATQQNATHTEAKRPPNFRLVSTGVLIIGN